MTENIITGRFYRILVDKIDNVWNRVSFWKKASDVEFNDGTNLENNKPVGVLKRNTLYEVGAVVYTSAAPSWARFKCIQRGQTKSSLPVEYETISVGGSITDGTAKFVACSVVPDTTLSTNQYQIPAMRLVNNLNSQLTANGKKFYFAYRDGKYGYIAKADGEEGTFVPF